MSINLLRRKLDEKEKQTTELINRLEDLRTEFATVMEEKVCSDANCGKLRADLE